MHIFFSKNPNFFASTCPPASFFMAKLTRTKQLIDCGLSKLLLKSLKGIIAWIKKILNKLTEKQFCISVNSMNIFVIFRTKQNQEARLYCKKQSKSHLKAVVCFHHYVHFACLCSDICFWFSPHAVCQQLEGLHFFCEIHHSVFSSIDESLIKQEQNAVATALSWFPC